MNNYLKKTVESYRFILMDLEEICRAAVISDSYVCIQDFCDVKVGDLSTESTQNSVIFSVNKKNVSKIEVNKNSKFIKKC